MTSARAHRSVRTPTGLAHLSGKTGLRVEFTAFILIMIATVWAIISTVSEVRIKKEPPCRTEFGVPKDQEWCDARYR